LLQAIRSDNPVIFFEHVLLYNVKGETHDGDYCQSLERAEVVREGTDVSIFTYSRMRYVVMQAVAELEKRGYNPEVGVGGWVGGWAGVWVYRWVTGGVT
jgi:pyruvate dehydrogenase E1 component beta subunit